MSASTTATGRDHRIRRMIGRDPGETHRAATPLELLFDLTFVVAFSQAGSETAHLLAEGEVGAALAGFVFSLFAIGWAWIGYTWLASAYDNEDIVFRIATLVQMVGVLVLALGLPPVFDSIAHGEPLDNGIAVAGYVIMRVATVPLWIRAARDDPAHRPAALAYLVWIVVVQLGWILFLVADVPLALAGWWWGALVVLELSGPFLAERRFGGTPWHPGHIAERYGLLVIITLGEVVLGTILAISAVVEEQGWTGEAVLVAASGTTLAFGLWWVYFTMPSGEVLVRHPRRSFVWGYGHLVLFGAIAAIGAGLHVAASVIEGVAHLDEFGAVLCVVIPVAVFFATAFVLYSLLLHRFDPFDLVLFAGVVLCLVGAVVAVAAGASMGWALAITALAPVVVIVGFETAGHRRQHAALVADGDV
ncbi:low temperature requirement protein A [Agromyces seonyuensis]|uniref:Low temperature requirement protein A n=1 Tax=Agromyces seonyuensis TaxID=2662446 RepID=A0A6I4P5M8_9MICO|nr:low temperature requirement protein A [Agromyces seonyuensis]MWB98754.1 low temperature requirement protein A [Agromyces seonyuensis]